MLSVIICTYNRQKYIYNCLKSIAENDFDASKYEILVVNNNSIIVSVFYDEDGDWQFFGKEEVSEEDAIVVSIQEMIDIDKSLVNLPDLKEGESAYRKNKESIWLIRK